MSSQVAQSVGRRAEVVICQSPPVLQWAVSLTAGSQRESPETLRGGKTEKEKALFIYSTQGRVNVISKRILTSKRIIYNYVMK